MTGICWKFICLPHTVGFSIIVMTSYWWLVTCGLEYRNFFKERSSLIGLILNSKLNVYLVTLTRVSKYCVKSGIGVSKRDLILCKETWQCGHFLSWSNVDNTGFEQRENSPCLRIFQRSLTLELYTINRCKNLPWQLTNQICCLMHCCGLKEHSESSLIEQPTFRYGSSNVWSLITSSVHVFTTCVRSSHPGAYPISIP